MTMGSEGTFGLVDRAGIPADDTDLFINGHGLERVDVSEQPAGRVALADLNILTQARSEYDPAGIRELALSMVKTSEASLEIELIHSPIILEFSSPDSLLAYLKDYDAFYGASTDLSQLHVSQDGLVRIVDAGHRRSLAMKHLAETLGVSLEDFTFPATVMRDIGFDEAVSNQMRENIHDRPPKTDQAKMIERYYKYMSANRARKPTQKQCADALGLSERVVSEALRFAQLPTDIQTSFTKGDISFENAVQLYRYMTVLRPYYAHKYQMAYMEPGTERTLEGDIDDGLKVMVNKLIDAKISGVGSKDKDEFIRRHIATIEETFNYAQGLFEMDQEPSPAEQRKRSETKLAKKALDITIANIDSLMATPEGRERLAQLSGVIQAAHISDAVIAEEIDDMMPIFDARPV